MNAFVMLLAEITAAFTVALLITRLASRRSAAVRHLILATAFSIALVLPLAMLVSPTIIMEIDALPVHDSRPVAISAAKLPDALPFALPDEASASRPSRVEPPVVGNIPSVAPARPTLPAPSWPVTTWLLLAWAIVTLMALVPVGTILWQLRCIRSRSHAWPEGAARMDQLMPAPGNRLPCVLLCDGIAAPITAGLLRPTITLPTNAVTWSGTHLANALLHELEHVRRHDWTVHLISRAACALYWFHPLAWMAWRSLRLEAERACDDAVLARADAATYAGQLLDLARCLTGRPALPGLQMAGDSNLAARIKALLDDSQPRGRTGRRQLICTFVVAVAAIVVLAPLRAAGPHPPNKRTQAPAARLRPESPAADRPPVVDASASGFTIRRLAAPITVDGKAWIAANAIRKAGRLIAPNGQFSIELSDENDEGDIARWHVTYAGVGDEPVDLVPDVTGFAYITADSRWIFLEPLDVVDVQGWRRYRLGEQFSILPYVVLTAVSADGQHLVIGRQECAVDCRNWPEEFYEISLPGAAPAKPSLANSGVDPQRAVVASILELVQSALADEATRTVDEIMYPITGLHHVQRFALAVLNDAGVDPARQAGNYLEIINALNNTADLAANAANRPPAPGISAPRYRQLAQQLQAKAGELAALAMPITSLVNSSSATPDHRAAQSVLELTQMTRGESSLPGSPWRSWMLTELNTLDRAARSIAGDDGRVLAATALKRNMFRLSMRSTALQAERISERAEASPDARRRTAVLAASLRDIANRLDSATTTTATAPEENFDNRDWSITVRTAGPLSIGMPITEVRRIIGDPSAYLIQALHQDHALPREPDTWACGYLVTNSIPGQLGLMFQYGRLARVDVWQSGIRTAGTAMVGDSELKIRNLYGTQLTITQHHYGSVGAHYMTYTPAAEADRDYLLRFETDGSNVTQFRVGLRAAVEATEGCE